MKKTLFTSFIYLLLAIQPSQAADKNWVCGSGSWDNSACWSPVGQPLSGDDVFLIQSDEINRTITYSNTDSPANISRLNIVAAGTGKMTFSHNQGDFFIDGFSHIGADGVGIYNQSGGRHIALGVSLGRVDAGNGTYNLTGGSLLTDVSEIGSSGSGVGTFNQYAESTHQTATAFEIHRNSTYNLYGGTLDNANSAVVLSGTFNQSGGSNFGYASFGLVVDGAYNLSGGTIEYASANVGSGGVFNQTNGISRFNTFLDKEGGLAIAGTYNLSGGALESNRMVLNSDGIFNFTGGSLAVNNFTGNLVNKGGTLAPGKSPGTTTVDGDYTQLSSGIFEVEINGLVQGSEHDWLNITGNATLGGTLDVDLFNLGSGSFTLGEGNVFDILSAESITGEFDLLTLAVLDEGLEWNISYLTDVSGTTDLVRLTVNHVNLIPEANAGEDQIVNESDAVNLNGNGSSDRDGSIDSYDWTQTAGTPVALSGATTATPSFAAPVGISDTTLTFSLIVTDNDGGESNADNVDIVVGNVNGLPTAFAGVNQVVNEGVLVNLDGRASSDSDGDISAYSWTQTAGTDVKLSGANTAKPSFTAPSVISDAVLMFSLEVTDAEGGSDTDLVAITVANALVVDAGVDQQVTEEELVQLDGLNSLMNSLFISGNVNAYQWTQTEGPVVTLDDDTSATPSFTAPSVDETTLLVFKLTVTDGNGSQDFDTTLVNVRDVQVTDRAPPLDVQLLKNTVESGGVLYQFETTSDPFTNSIKVQWAQINGPAVTLDNADTKIPSFLTPIVSADSVATFEVRSEDVNGLLIRASVKVNILSPDSRNQSPTANAGKDQNATEGDTVKLNATASTDADGHIISYYWQQTGGPVVALTSIMQAQASFVAPAIAAVDDGSQLTFELVVTDDGGFVGSQSVTITLSDNGISVFADDVIAIVSSSGDPIGIQPVTDGRLVAVEAVDPGSIVDDINRPDFLPYGLLNFSLRVEPGASVEVSIALPAPADAGMSWWKYSNDSGWLDYGANVTFNATRDVMTITLTDNGLGDDDPTPGVIRDPGGLALASAGSSSSDSGGGGSTGPLLLVFLLLGFFARSFAGYATEICHRSIVKHAPNII